MTVDHISGGRVDFGVGAGWVEREHEAYGFAFPSARERVDRFAEALEIWHLLQTQERTTYEGTHYQLLDAPFQPKSLQSPRMPVLIGGSGPRMLRLTARHADIWNCGGTPDEAAAVNRRLDDACAAEGRDPATLVRTVSPGINLLESIEAFAEGVAAYRAAGFRDIYLPWPRTDAEVPVLRQVARDLLPQLQGRPPLPVSSLPAQPEPQQLTPGPWPLPADATAQLVLTCLVEHPDERLDGAAIMRLTGIERHADVTRAFARMAETFAAAGLARPWSEAQRGWLLPREAAEKLGQN
jgi:alkanesulfonate monooxygenase SsuD/methylene tetrahydromethanopterin reductase-like flavin-dependent oxidoreductase (luciferase family)